MKSAASILYVVALLAMTNESVYGQDTDDSNVEKVDVSEVTAANASAEAESNPVAEDDEAARELALALRKQLSGTKDELAETARVVGLPLIASLKHDLNIARVDQRRRRMESARVSVIQMADQAADELRGLMTQMHEELATIRKQFEDDDPQICEMEQVAVVKAFRVRLQALKEREELCRGKAGETSKELVDLRRDKVTRERARWLAQKAPDLAPTAKSPVPRLEWVRSGKDGDSDEKPDVLLTGSESLKEVLASIEELDNRK